MTDVQQVTFCQRCGAMVRLAGPGRKDAKMLRYAKQPKGYCASCAVHDWLRNTYPVNIQLAESGPKILLHEGIRKMFSDIMRAGNADAKPDEINWNLIVENWELPFADKVKPTNTNPCTQAQFDEIAAGKRKGLRYEPPKPDPLKGVHTITSFEQLNLLEPGLGDDLRETLDRHRREAPTDEAQPDGGDPPADATRETVSTNEPETRGKRPMGRRKTSDAVEEKRKPVKVRPIERKHAGKVQEPYRLLEELIAAHHPELEGAKFILLWRDGWKPDVDKVLTLGRLKKASDLDQAIGSTFGDGYDFAVQLNADAWPKLSDDRKRQVIDHELCHAAPDLDRDGKQKMDAKERLCWRVRKHPIQEFPEILERYGVEEVLRLNEAAKKAVEDADRPLIAAIEQSQGKAKAAGVPARIKLIEDVGGLGAAGSEWEVVADAHGDLWARTGPTAVFSLDNLKYEVIASKDRKPGGWRNLPVEALQLHDGGKIKDRQIKALQDGGIATLGDLADLMDRAATWWHREVKGIGKDGKATIEDALAAIRAQKEGETPKAA
jgi:hypothetical protein